MFFFKFFYFIFLLMFSYLMLCEFRLFIIKPENLENGELTINTNISFNFTKNISKLTESNLHVVYPHWLEYLICFWIFSLACQEIYQVRKYNDIILRMKIYNNSIKLKINSSYYIVTNLGFILN